LSPYHELIALLVEERSFTEALVLAEGSKARVLTQLLRGNRLSDEEIISAAEKSERARLRQNLYTLNRQIETAQTTSKFDPARREARATLAAFETSPPARYPELAARRGELAAVNREGLSYIINPASAAVEYVVTGKQVFAFVVTTDGKQATVTGRAINI